MGFPLLGNEIKLLDSVDSTSNYVAKSLEEGSLAAGQVIMAHYQTAGRGQHGRFWQSADRQNTLFSFALSVNAIAASQQFLLSKAISLAIVSYLDGLKLSAVEIKWPNDILVDRRKIAGMLLEFKSIEARRMAIIGIGLNVNEMFRSALFRATSLRAEVGYPFDPIAVLKDLIISINRFLPAAFEPDGHLLQMAYLGRLFGKGEWIDFQDKERTYQGKIQDVDDRGQLVVKSRQGYSTTYQMREVKINY